MKSLWSIIHRHLWLVRALHVQEEREGKCTMKCVCVCVCVWREADAGTRQQEIKEADVWRKRKQRERERESKYEKERFLRINRWSGLFGRYKVLLYNSLVLYRSMGVPQISQTVLDISTRFIWKHSTGFSAITESVSVSAFQVWKEQSIWILMAFTWTKIML